MAFPIPLLNMNDRHCFPSLYRATETSTASLTGDRAISTHGLILWGLFDELSSAVSAFELLFTVVDMTLINRLGKCAYRASRRGKQHRKKLYFSITTS